MQQYFDTLMKAAALNDAIFLEANDWSCISVWMPPGKRVDNPWTIFQAGFVGALLKLGIGGCKVRLPIFWFNLRKGANANYCREC